MSFRPKPHPAHEKDLSQRGDRHEQRSPHADRHSGDERARRHPVRAGLQRLRQAVTDRESRALLRDYGVRA
jgi:hypothetical protein